MWEWTPPFRPIRSHRYAYDYCPQLAALPLPAESPVVPAAGYRFVDRDVYRFSRGNERRPLRVQGKDSKVLQSNNQCRELLLPETPWLTARYGLGGEPAVPQATFRLLVRSVPGGEETLLFEDVLTPPRSTGERILELADFALQRLELCVETLASASPADTEAFAYWMNPAIHRGPPDHREPDDEAQIPADLDPQELEVQRRHLRALGYLN